MVARSTKRVKNKNSSPSQTLEDLEQEAKEFKQGKVKKTVDTEKPLTPRQHLAGIIFAGLLARSQGLVNVADLRQEAYDLADTLLEYE